MDEATANAIGEATVRLDAAAKQRDSIGALTEPPDPIEFMAAAGVHSMLAQEAQGWAMLAVAAAIAGNSSPEMPDVGAIMSHVMGQMGGAG